jgi:hypothetical protein
MNIGRIALVALAVALVAGLAVALIHSGAGTGASGNTAAGTGNVKSFSTGGSYAYSVSSVSKDEAKHLQDQGVQVITVPASKAIYVTSQAGRPPEIRTGDLSTLPNTIIFGPGGFISTGVWPGPGVPMWAWTGPGAGASVVVGPGGVAVNAVPSTGTGASVQVGGGAGAGVGTGVASIDAGTTYAAPVQVYSFSGNAGDTYLVTQQSDGKVDRVLVTFQ